MRKTLIAVGAAAVALAGAGAAAVQFVRTGDGNVAVRLEPRNAELVALGAEVYAAQCASCHGATLEGEANWRERRPDGLLPAPPHDETGHTWHHPDALLFQLTKYGPPKEIDGKPYLSAMPAFEGTLTDREILAVLSYIKSRWPDDVAARHDLLNRSVGR